MNLYISEKNIFVIVAGKTVLSPVELIEEYKEESECHYSSLVILKAFLLYLL